jgi:hypothetical protein
VLTPFDTKSWPTLCEELWAHSKDYSTAKFIGFLNDKYKKRGYGNIRLIRKIKTEYFWNGVAQFMLEEMANNSYKLANKVHILTAKQCTLLKLTKHEVFLILCHLFAGTFPAQLLAPELSFGPLMTVHSDEDELTTKTKLELRENKLKAIVRYFCLFYKRALENPNICDHVVAFQRFSLN